MAKTNTKENSPVTRRPHAFNAHAYCEFIADSIKVALSIGNRNTLLRVKTNCALGRYCLVVTHATHCIVPYAQKLNDQLPKQPFLI